MCISTWLNFSSTMPEWPCVVNEPRQANSCLRAFRHDKFQLCMPSHSEGPGIWLSVWRFLLTHCLYERAAKVLARLRGCAGLPEPSLLAYAISTKFAWRGPNVKALSKNSYARNKIHYGCLAPSKYFATQDYFLASYCKPCNPASDATRFPWEEIFNLNLETFKHSSIWAMSWENFILPYANNKDADQPAHPCSLISVIVIRCLDSIILLVSISVISSLKLAPVAEEASLSLTWLETPKTGFLMMWPIL